MIWKARLLTFKFQPPFLFYLPREKYLEKPNFAVFLMVALAIALSPLPWQIKIIFSFFLNYI
jgi:hypothetical protein